MEKVKVAGLMTVLTLILVGVGGYFGGNSGAVVAFVASLAMNFGMYWFSDKIVLRQYRAHIVERGAEGGRFDGLYDMVDRLRQRAGLPMPVVAVAEQMQPNAFATGRNPEHAVVCVTRGMWELVARGDMTVDELEGVMAHELAHVKHRHMLVGTIAASMAGAIMMLARFGMFLGGGSSRGGNNNAFAMLAFLILAPIASMVIQMMISRRNEFEADAGAATMSGKPLALASALAKIHRIGQHVTMEVSPAAAHLAISNPLAGGRGLMNLFSTHPPMEQRVAKLRELAASSGSSPLGR